MADLKLKESIVKAINSFSNEGLTQLGLNLFNTLGYDTSKETHLDSCDYETFSDAFIGEQHNFNLEKAKTDEWKYIDLLFQLTKGEILKRTSLFDTKQIENTIIESYLFIAIELENNNYSRTALSNITREINKLFPMPVMVLFKHGTSLTFSIINRRIHKRDQTKDVLEKVTLIKDINISNPHRAHIEILFDLAFDELNKNNQITNFVELHKAWQKVLDTKELNKKFFQELSSWYFWAVKHFEFPDDEEKNRDVRNATNVIRLLTRLMFVWFLKEKGLINHELFDKKLVQDILNDLEEDSSTYYKAILQNLFFATLNTEMGKRKFRVKSNGSRDGNYFVHNVFRYEDYFQDSKESLDKYFANIPFLNGGLFECLDKEIDEKGKVKRIRIDGFSDRKDNQLYLPNKFFFHEDVEKIDLNEVYGTKNKKYDFRGIIDILNSYKFTIAENTPIEEEIALDPELLGKVFENLLANYNPETQTTARKQTGSFYTPREIVNYMVDESIIAYLNQKLSDNEESENKLRQLISYTDEPHLFNDKEVKTIINSIDTIKILDPACGSGAFPMGILHKLVHILHKLDPMNKGWKQKQIDKASQIDDANARDAAIDSIEEAFENNELDYGRKLFLIENCIYGVDIQPIAAQISKLRFFISLIVDQRTDISHKNLSQTLSEGDKNHSQTLSEGEGFKSSPSPSERDGVRFNRGIRPLPNLETKFVAANTLIKLEKEQDQTTIFDVPEIDKIKGELRNVRHRYFEARTPATKSKYRQKDKELREKLAAMMIENKFLNNENASKLASWDPYNQNTYADFFEPEWMFGLKDGFDIVIGNPPYVLLQNLNISNSTKDYYMNNYFVAQYKTDLFHLFIENGIKQLKANGIISYITPNTFIKNKHNNKLRKFIIVNTDIKSIVLFYKQVFESASVDNIVFHLQKRKQTTEPVKIIEIKDKTSDISNRGRFFDKIFIKSPNYEFNFDFTSEYISISSKLKNEVKTIKEIGRAYFGIQTYDRGLYVSKNKRDQTYQSVIDGGNILRYSVLPPNEFVSFKPEAIKSGGNKSVYIEDRIVVRQIGKYPEGSICKANIYTLNTVYNINIYTKSYTLEYVLAIINSTLIKSYWLSNFFDNKETFPKIKKAPLESIPVKIATSSKQKPFIIIVNYIIFAKSKYSDLIYSFFERLIDAMVYELYFPEEIKAANAEVLKRLTNLPELKEGQSDEEKLAIIEKVQKELSDPKHPVSIAMFRMESVEEIRIIEGRE